MSNTSANAELDARHKKEPETEFSFTLGCQDALELNGLLGETYGLVVLHGDLCEWLKRNGYL